MLKRQRPASALIGGLTLMISTAAANAAQRLDPLQAVRQTGPAETNATAQRDRLEASVDQADEPMERVRAHLALANWWLAVPTGRPATRWLLDMEDKSDRQAILDAAQHATQQLKEARSALDDLPKPKDADGKREVRELRSTLDALESFVEIFERAELGKESDADQENWRKAGRSLAIARESDDKELAAAALLWQAFALEQAGKQDRALDALPDALAKPENLPYSLMSRLLRCRLIADAGEAPAAVILLSRMEAQTKNWLGNQNQERNKARRLIGLVQYRIVTQWMERLNASTQPAGTQGAESLQSVLEGVERGFTEIKEPEVYSMGTAIPLSIAPAARAASETRSAPAD